MMEQTVKEIVDAAGESQTVDRNQKRILGLTDIVS